MKLQAFYHAPTFTLTYVVWDEASKDAVVIDPVLDYDPLASVTQEASTDALCAFLEQRGLALRWVLETHAHADHLSSAPLLKARTGAQIAIGARITEVQSTFKDVFALDERFATDGRQFDRLLEDGEALQVGGLRVEVIATPGHTPACVSYKIEDAVFTGDALFMDDYGTGRCDFPAGSAKSLYDSVHERLYALDDNTRVFVGHDYQPGGRALAYETTIGRSKAKNPHIRAETTEAEFVRFREARDASLSPPRLLYQSVQVNIDAGRLPDFLKLPLRRK